MMTIRSADTGKELAGNLQRRAKDCRRTKLMNRLNCMPTMAWLCVLTVSHSYSPGPRVRDSVCTSRSPRCEAAKLYV
jgi:hypothetical protein